jgi:hypothetical protein
MPQFAANLSMMYPDMDFLDRFEAAAKDGFKAVEYLFPYAYRPQELAARLKGNGLQQVLFNMPPGGIDDVSTLSAWEKGDRGTACSPGSEAEYRAGVQRAMQYAQVLACPRIHSMAGILPAGVSREAAHATFNPGAKLRASVRYLFPIHRPFNVRDSRGNHFVPLNPWRGRGGEVDVGGRQGNGGKAQELLVSSSNSIASASAWSNEEFRRRVTFFVFLIGNSAERTQKQGAADCGHQDHQRITWLFTVRSHGQGY